MCTQCEKKEKPCYPCIYIPCQTRFDRAMANVVRRVSGAVADAFGGVAHYLVEHLFLGCGDLIRQTFHQYEPTLESRVHEPKSRYAHYQSVGQTHCLRLAIGYRFDGP